jgi:hypothetical protein
MSATKHRYGLRHHGGHLTPPAGPLEIRNFGIIWHCKQRRNCGGARESALPDLQIAVTVPGYIAHKGF